MALVEMFKYWGYDSLETGTHPDGTPIYDRAIDSADVALFNELLYTSGIDKNYEDCFKIVPGDGLTIIRQPGHASLGGRPALDPNPRTVTLVSGNKYYYVMESNAELEYRMAREGVLLAAETSIPPQRDENHYQIILALIDVPSGVSQITADMITDLRFNDDCCGVITINANYDFEQLLITADDIHDTDTRLIPVKTGDGSRVLHDDGGYDKIASSALDVLDNLSIGNYSIRYENGDFVFYDSDVIIAKITSEGNIVWSGGNLDWLGNALNWNNYKFIANGANIDITYDEAGAPAFCTPISGNVSSGSVQGGTALESSIKASGNTSTYAEIWKLSEPLLISVAYAYGNLPNLDSSTVDINITLKFHYRIMSYAEQEKTTLTTKLYLRNMDTGQNIPNTEQIYTTNSTGFTRTANYTFNFNAFADLNATNIGVYAEITRGEGTFRVRIYGSDLTITHNIDRRTIGKLTPDGIITSPGGTVQTMMTQGILDNTQEILLLKEGIEI